MAAWGSKGTDLSLMSQHLPTARSFSVLPTVNNPMQRSSRFSTEYGMLGPRTPQPYLEGAGMLASTDTRSERASLARISTTNGGLFQRHRSRAIPATYQTTANAISHLSYAPTPSNRGLPTSPSLGALLSVSSSSKSLLELTRPFGSVGIIDNRPPSVTAMRACGAQSQRATTRMRLHGL